MSPVVHEVSPLDASEYVEWYPFRRELFGVYVAPRPELAVLAGLGHDRPNYVLVARKVGPELVASGWFAGIDGENVRWIPAHAVASLRYISGEAGSWRSDVTPSISVADLVRLSGALFRAEKHKRHAQEQEERNR